MKAISNKIILLISLIITVLLLGGGSFLGYTYYQAATGKSKIVVPDFTITSPKKIKLGDLITAKMIIKCPWGHYPKSVEIKPPDGLQTVTEPTIHKKGISWGKTIWEIITKIQPYKTGKLKSTPAKVIILQKENGKSLEQEYNSKIPGINVIEIETGRTPQLYIADKEIKRSIAERNPWIIAIFAGLILILIIIFIIIWIRKREKYIESIVTPPWAEALNLLKELRNALKEHKLNNQVCLSKLTDIVRNYLENRFNKKVASQTTTEFLSSLEKEKSPLSNEHKQFLKEFLQAADMVKFAKLPANESLIENALQKAEQLVESTTPQIETKKKKGGENV